MNDISIIITTYNQAAWVIQAVESALTRHSQTVEVIVVDGGSTDETPEVFAKCSTPVTYIRQSHHEIMAARLAGLNASTGAFLTFMQAEDLLPTLKLEGQAQRLEQQPELGLVYFSRPLTDGDDVHIVPEAVSDGSVRPNSGVVAAELFLSGGPLIRRDCIERMGFREAALSPETDWNPWERLTLAGYELDPKERSALYQEHIDIAFRKLTTGDQGAARRHLIESVRLLPSVVEDPETFFRSVLDYTKRPEINDPVAFVQRVLDNLPDGMRALKRYRNRMVAELQISKAFHHYRLGEMREVRQQVLGGLLHDPAHLKNRGIISILYKSFLNGKSQSGIIHHREEKWSLSPQIAHSIQAALGQRVDLIERTVGGTHRNTFLVKSCGRSAILRLAVDESDISALRRMIAVTERARAAGVPIPAIIAHSFPVPREEAIAWVLEEWVSGHAFNPHVMRWRDALSVAAELGRCLRQLHSIETDGFGLLSEHLEAAYPTLGLWLDSEARGWDRLPSRLTEETLSLIEAACQFLREAYQGTPRLCHLDPNPWNLLVVGADLSAVIDWNHICGCDPAFSVAILHFWIDDEEILSTLLQTYAPAEPEVFRQRIGAAIAYYAAAVLASDYSGQAIDKQLADHQSLMWLTEESHIRQLNWHSFDTRRRVH
jgi:glycosyltransferase involved in cell wall biosynthesis/thiamine kinase-like enzyme